MRTLFFIFSGLLFFTATNAQLVPSIRESKKLVFDNQKIFTAKEITGLDTMLQKYRETTGRIVLISTDTLDVSSQYYADNIVNQYVTDTANRPLFSCFC